jgi:ATP phosphoribosyltransferase regulatory subunit
VVTVLCRALDAAGLARYRVGLGDAALYPALLESLGVPEDRRALLLDELGRGDFVSLETALAELELDEGQVELLLSVPQLRGGPDVLHGPAGPVADAVAGLRDIHALLEHDVAARVIFDLGLSRAPGYYTGAVFEVYDPAVGMPIGGGGRYDHLLGQFGRELPAVGFALEVEKLHLALAAEERL